VSLLTFIDLVGWFVLSSLFRKMQKQRKSTETEH